MRRTYFMGERDLPEIVLTARERATLASAARILTELRELRDDADDDLTTDIALAGHVCAELANEARIAQ